jgi:hypothetical protein
MQFTNEVNWTLFDFVVAGVLLLGTGFICELVIRKVKPIIESFFVELFWQRFSSFGLNLQSVFSGHLSRIIIRKP